MKKNILILTPKIPKKNGVGYQVLSYYRILSLSRFFNITLICLENDNSARSELSDIYSYVDRIIYFEVSILSKLIGVVKSFFNLGFPFQCGLYDSLILKNILKRELDSCKYYSVICYTIRPLTNLNFYSGKLVVEFVDSMSLNFYRRSRKLSVLKFIYYLESIKCRIYEKKILSCDNVIGFVVSKIDMKFIDDTKLHVLPLGVATLDKYPTYIIDSNSKRNIIFSGNMSYQPNIEAVLWFVDNCFVPLKRKYTDLTFTICGNKPSDQIKALQSIEGVIITGFVHDIFEYIRNSYISIAPMQSGSGMQFKILEACSLSVPVVATELGRGDIQLEHGLNCLIANTPVDFVDAISSLFDNEILHRSIAIEARNFIESKHTWHVINKSFLEIITGEIYEI